MDSRDLVVRDEALESCSNCLKTMFKHVFKRFGVECRGDFGTMTPIWPFLHAFLMVLRKKSSKIDPRGHTMSDVTLQSGSKWLKVKVIGGFLPRFLFDNGHFLRSDTKFSKIWRFSKFLKMSNFGPQSQNLH